MEILTIKEVGELEGVADRVLELLGGVERQDRAAVLALHGDLGSGKTTFVQVLAKKLGVSETVVSPTFVVMKHYELPEEQYSFTDLYHLDCYRVESEEEMGPLHFAELLALPKALIVIEWAERIAALLPEAALHASFTINDDTRTIALKNGD